MRNENRKRIAALITVLIIILCIFIVHAEENPYYGLTPMWVMCRSYVIVRNAPNKNAQELGWIDTGEKVWTDGNRIGQYIHLLILPLETGDGWVHGGYLVEDEPENVDKLQYRVNSNGRVALRRTVNGQRRAWAYPGATMKVYMISDEWALTNRGYIRAEFIEYDPE